MKSKKNILIIAVAITAVLFFISLSQNGELFLASSRYPSQEKDKELVVAACPTFYYMLEELKIIGLKTIETNTTAESLYYLEQGKADLIIAGRALKPGEPEAFFKIIGPGYSFLADREFAISEKEMINYRFFTDLSLKELTEKFPHIAKDKITVANNIYDHLSDGIIITSIENTDYSRAEIVHVFREDGSRHRFSRTPVIYYLNQEVLPYYEQKLSA